MRMLQKIQSKWSWAPKEGVEIGRLSGSSWRHEVLTDGQLNHHVHVVGASGFGKTVLLSHIIKSRIERESGLLFIDLKGDIDTILKFSHYAIQSGRGEDLYCFSLSDPKYCLSYNPIQDGTANQLRDRIMQSLKPQRTYHGLSQIAQASCLTDLGSNIAHNNN